MALTALSKQLLSGHAFCKASQTGIAYLFTAMQAGNLKAAYMHLTNYAVNKHNKNFMSGPDTDSSKWDFASLRYSPEPLQTFLQYVTQQQLLVPFWI